MKNIQNMKFMECLLAFRQESFSSLCSTQKHKAKNFQSFSFLSCFVWVGNLVSHIKRRTQTEDVQEREIFGPKGEEVTGAWRMLHNEELCILYCPPNSVGVIKQRRMRLLSHMACMGRRGNLYRVLVGKCEGERTLGPIGSIWHDDIKMGPVL